MTLTICVFVPLSKKKTVIRLIRYLRKYLLIAIILKTYFYVTATFISSSAFVVEIKNTNIGIFLQRRTNCLVYTYLNKRGQTCICCYVNWYLTAILKKGFVKQLSCVWKFFSKCLKILSFINFYAIVSVSFFCINMN